MVNVQKHIQHWIAGADESWADAEALIEKGRINFGAFAAHLAIEKALKARVTKATGDIPPRTHNLPHLAELAALNLTQDYK